MNDPLALAKDAQTVSWSHWWRSEKTVADEWESIAQSLRRPYLGENR